MNEFLLSAMANKVAWRASCSKEDLERTLADERFFEISQRVLESMDGKHQKIYARSQEDAQLLINGTRQERTNSQ